MTKKNVGFADLAKSFAQVYNLENSPEVFNGDYEEQCKNPALVGMLLFNCMVMNSLYGCMRGGCIGCRARTLFDNVKDPALRSRIDGTMYAMRKEDAKVM